MIVTFKSIDKEKWDKLIIKAQHSNLTQDWIYGHYKSKISSFDVKRISIKINNKLIAIFQVFYKTIPFLPFFKLYYINRGPVFLENIDDSIMKIVFNQISKRYSLSKFKILYINPYLQNKIENQNILKSSGLLRMSKKKYNTIHINLKSELDQLRSNLNSKWRNQLVKAEKNQVKIIIDTELKYKSFIIDKNNMMMKIKNYKGIDSDSLNYLFDQFHNDNKVFNFIALSPENNKPIAYTVFLSFSNIAVYFLGWVDLDGRKFNPSNLLLWSAVSHFKDFNYKLIDLGGIDEKETPGITKFKRGLNGEELSFLEGCLNFRL